MGSAHRKQGVKTTKAKHDKLSNISYSDVRAKRAERRANAYIKGANNDEQRTARQERQMARRAWKRRR
jgi:hypothetical protein